MKDPHTWLRFRAWIECEAYNHCLCSHGTLWLLSSGLLTQALPKLVKHLPSINHCMLQVMAVVGLRLKSPSDWYHIHLKTLLAKWWETKYERGSFNYNNTKKIVDCFDWVRICTAGATCLLCATLFNVQILGCHGTMLATFQSAGNVLQVTKRMAYTVSYNTITHCTSTYDSLCVPFFL